MLLKALLFGALAIAVSAQTEVEMFVGPVGEDASYAVSVVEAADCTTTFGVVCTAGHFNAASLSSSSIPCDPEVTGYITKGPSSYGASTQTMLFGTQYIVIDECNLDGRTAATCSVTFRASGGGDSTATTITTTFTGSQVAFAQVTVTAGAMKLETACSASGNAAARPTAGLDVYKVLVVPAAALLAGAVV